MTTRTRKEDLVESVLQLADRAFRELFPILPKEWLRLDLTMPQLKVVLVLFLNGPSRMSSIAQALDVSLATATGVVDRLVERGIVGRDGDPHDRRVVLCHLSDDGQKLIGDLWKLARDRAAELLRAMDPPKLALVVDFLEALLQAGAVPREDS